MRLSIVMRRSKCNVGYRLSTDLESKNTGREPDKFRPFFFAVQHHSERCPEIRGGAISILRGVSK